MRKYMYVSVISPPRGNVDVKIFMSVEAAVTYTKLLVHELSKNHRRPGKAVETGAEEVEYNIVMYKQSRDYILYRVHYDDIGLYGYVVVKKIEEA